VNSKTIKRGDIYYADLGQTVGSEQGFSRPVLVVQNNVGNRYSPTIIIAPLTGNIRKTNMPTHVFIPRVGGLRHDSLALVEQLRAVDRMRLDGYVGCISEESQMEIDTALAVAIGIEERRSPKGELFILTLCSRCEGDFIESGLVVVRKGWQKIKEDCDFCNARKGITFGVFSAHINDTALEPFSRNKASTENRT
jgi:mRNA interferase MazF